MLFLVDLQDLIRLYFLYVAAPSDVQQKKASTPDKKKKPSRPCIFCGVFQTRLSRHLKGKRGQPSTLTRSGPTSHRHCSQFLLSPPTSSTPFSPTSWIVMPLCCDAASLPAHLRPGSLQLPLKSWRPNVSGVGRKESG